MSTKIKSCSPGTRCEPILNDQAILSFFKIDEINKFLEDDNARSLNDTGAYLGYSTDLTDVPKTYAGESTTEDSGGVQDRIVKDHKVNKPFLTHYMVLLNATIDGHRKLDSNTFKLMEHLFKASLTYANKSEVINIKRTGGSVSPESYLKVICPMLIDIKYSVEGVLGHLLNPDNDQPVRASDSKAFKLNDGNLTEIYLNKEVILKHSHFKFPHKKIRESNECFTLLTNLINAGLCIPYVYNGEVVMKFIIDTNLSVPHMINSSQKKDFFINERTLSSLMGSNVEFKSSFK